jgi:hypothetical protein
MTQLELVEHEQVINAKGQNIRRTVVAVSSSWSALVEHCKDKLGGKIDKVGCGKPTYFTIQQSKIVIVPSKF